MIEDNQKEVSILKNSYDVSPLSVPREALLEAVKRFLQGLAGDTALVSINNITSPDLGASDLTLVRKDRTGLTVVRLHEEENFHTFALLAAAYHCWLKECMQISGEILNRSISLDMYLISHDVPSGDSYLLKVLSRITSLAIIKYQIMNIEGEQASVVRFKHLGVGSSREDRFDKNNDRKEAVAEKIQEERKLPLHRLSSLELDEFNRLKERYLK
jgi:hypothetical protein